MLNPAHEWRLLPQTPTIHELPGGKGRDRVISFAEEILYLSKASQTGRDVATLAADTGLRPNSELFLPPGVVQRASAGHPGRAAGLPAHSSGQD
jgi:hypothetical protein